MLGPFHIIAQLFIVVGLLGDDIIQMLYFVDFLLVEVTIDMVHVHCFYGFFHKFDALVA